MDPRQAELNAVGEAPEDRAPEPRPGPARADDRGVDVTLLRWMLSLTPMERLDVLQKHVRDICELRAQQR